MTTLHSSTETLKLNNGATIPQVGLGTWRSPDDEGYNAVKSALKDGYRHIDTAKAYGNEEVVGRAVRDFIKESGVPRSEIFVTTKLWCTDFKDPVKAVKGSLVRLGLDYVDLLLMHWPLPMPEGEGKFPTNPDGSRKLIKFDEWNYLDTYRAMQKLVELKLTKAIGISNFNIPKIEAVLNDKDIHIAPAALQVELHPYLPQDELLAYCKKHGIVVEAYSPLGSAGAPLLKEKVLVDIAEKYGATPATIAVSWGVQRGSVILPKSVNPQRIAANLKIVTLSEEDMDAVNSIQKTTHKRLIDPDWGVNVFDTDYKFQKVE
ncbi:DEKNAAC101251 [Brettanomyces naardenensis]|uniref:2-dehydropantolactone reductase n=1 Tax=Brettanomyces naardenensis TaxID=13370 RepID=A0A448YHV5_BRENA|nr:DEKNAAC101251 [Brettanomyces naardenensis]